MSGCHRCERIHPATCERCIERDALARGWRTMHDEMLQALARIANEHGGTEWGRALWSAHERLKTEVKP